MHAFRVRNKDFYKQALSNDQTAFIDCKPQISAKAEHLSTLAKLPYFAIYSTRLKP